MPRNKKPERPKTRELHKRPGKLSTIYIRGIPRDVKNFFKAWCIKRNITMSEKIEQFMRDTLREDNQSEVQRNPKRAQRSV